MVSTTSPGKATVRRIDIESDGVAPAAASWVPNGVAPIAVSRSESAKASNVPPGSVSEPDSVVVIVSGWPVGGSAAWARAIPVKGGPRLLSRFDASATDENGCASDTVSPPSSVGVGPCAVQPCAVASSRFSAPASPGT